MKTQSSYTKFLADLLQYQSLNAASCTDHSIATLTATNNKTAAASQHQRQN